MESQSCGQSYGRQESGEHFGEYGRTSRQENVCVRSIKFDYTKGFACLLPSDRLRQPGTLSILDHDLLGYELAESYSITR
jgi:hypothetical protein